MKRPINPFLAGICVLYWAIIIGSIWLFVKAVTSKGEKTTKPLPVINQENLLNPETVGKLPDGRVLKRVKIQNNPEGIFNDTVYFLESGEITVNQVEGKQRKSTAIIP
jgi:hypothetical protein